MNSIKVTNMKHMAVINVNLVLSHHHETTKYWVNKYHRPYRSILSNKINKIVKRALKPRISNCRNVRKRIRQLVSYSALYGGTNVGVGAPCKKPCHEV